MTIARIYQPAKSTMQSGRGKMATWILEYAPASRKQADPMIGWIGSTDTEGQVKITFDTRDEAVAFAERNDITCRVIEPQSRRVLIKNYADKFAYTRTR